MTATLVATADEPRPGSVQLLRRHVQAGEDGDPPASVEVVCDVRPDGERIAVALTIVAVRCISIDLPERTVQEINERRASHGRDAVIHLTGSVAKACGHRGSDAKLQTIQAFGAEHPGMGLARAVWFALGDMRDRHRFVAAGWPDYTGDPGRAMRGEPEAVPRSYSLVLVEDAERRYELVRSEQARDAASKSPAERLRAIQAGTVHRD